LLAIDRWKSLHADRDIPCTNYSFFNRFSFGFEILIG